MVPYGEVWRTGAGPCTKIIFSETVSINNNQIPAGAYSLLSIPKEDTWTIILNSDTSLYGAGHYEQGKDVIRFETIPSRSERFFESFSIEIDVVPNNAAVYLSWENTQVQFSINTFTDERVERFIDKKLLNLPSNDASQYAMAADYYYYSNRKLEKAHMLIDRAIVLKPKAWHYRLKADILIRQEKYEDAKKITAKAIEFIEANSTNFGWDEATLNESINFFRNRQEEINRMM